MKFPLGHDSPFLSSPFHKYNFSLMNHHILIGKKMSQHHQCHQVLFLVPYNQAILWASVSLIISLKDKEQVFSCTSSFLHKYKDLYELSRNLSALELPLKQLSLASLSFCSVRSEIFISKLKTFQVSYEQCKIGFQKHLQKSYRAVF